MEVKKNQDYIVTIEDLSVEGEGIGKNYEYFFAYHDKNLWDATGHYIICMRAKDTWNELDPVGSADILLINI